MHHLLRNGGPQGRLAFRWMYLLCLVPVLTDIVETGGWPHSMREWITEISVGTLILLLVRRMSLHQRIVLALASSDPLTKLRNRATFDESVEDECARSRRSGQPLTLVYFDLDNFKQVNDTAGHAAGDRVLRQFGAAVRYAVRDRVDRAFRVGGDEFALLLPGSTAAQAEHVVARIRQRCAQSDPVWSAGTLGFSAGIAELQAGDAGADVVRRADEAMFHAKRTRGTSRSTLL